MNTTDVSSGHMDHHFSRDPAGLPEATQTQIVDLTDGQTYELVAAPVHKRIGNADARLLAYNGSVPGPTLRIRQGSSVTVNFTNQADHENTVHWHGLRVDNRFDGTHQTQAPVPVGGTFAYRIHVPDPGIYWYHPHIREDYGQEMGLYGNILVVPADSDYWPSVNREIALTVDDILLEDGMVAPFRRSETTHSAMGRFGNQFLVNGAPATSLDVSRDEVVRFYLTNTANTRVFNLGFSGARMKLVGGDSGRCEHEQLVESVMLAPSERGVVDVLFAAPGKVSFEHHTPDRSYELGAIIVNQETVTPSLASRFANLRSNADLVAERRRIEPFLDAAPDKTLAFIAEMDMGQPHDLEGPVVYTCPMHPEVVRNEPGRCPKCGMNLIPKVTPTVTTTYTCPMHPEIVRDAPGKCPICGMKLVPSALVAESGHSSMTHAADDSMAAHVHHGQHEAVPPRQQHQSADPHAHHGTHTAHHAGAENDQQHGGHQQDAHGTPATDGIEWEDDMVAINRATTPANMRWKLVDRVTGYEGHAIDWHFRVGERVKIRLINEMDSDHPMHHPFHIHGAGRFLVLGRDGLTESNLMWKDTVLVRKGETVDILLDVTNPGVWMAHCHIAEHHESGMMMSFHVSE